MEIQPGQDPKILREQQYVNDTHLDVRYRTHLLYTMDPVDFGQWTLERLAWRGDERVLDVGCGPGSLLTEMARHHQGWGLLVGFDFSAGMITTAIQSSSGLATHFCVADAQDMPFPDDLFDVVMARHMLYHVPDIDRAVAEANRVQRRGGSFLAITNSARSMPEYLDLRDRAAYRFPAVAQPDLVSDRFSLENAASFIEPYYNQVETHVLRGTLRFPTAQPFIDYVASGRTMLMRPDHSDAEWSAVLEFVRAETEAVITRQGHFDVTKITGAIVGTKRS